MPPRHDPAAAEIPRAGSEKSRPWPCPTASTSETAFGFPGLQAALARIPGCCVPRGRGWSAAAASILEASAPKPGNVHPAADFPDLSHADLVAAGLAIASAIDRAADVPLGRTILAAVTASRAVTRSNANLGIILAIAPLAAVADAGEDQSDVFRPTSAAEVLARLTPADAADVWEAIRLANPGGLGRSDGHDLGGPPPDDLMAAMRLAAPRDAIARLWAEGYRPLHDGLVADLAAEVDDKTPLEDAVVRAFLMQLAREPDTLIARKYGRATADDVSRRAADVLADPTLLPSFDRWLRSPRRLNPGATADLTAAAIYILIRQGRLLNDPPSTPPPLPSHPACP